MSTASLAFEPTASWCYQFARYQAIPEILVMPEVTEGRPFRLIELSKRVLDSHLVPDQQAMTYKRARTEGDIAIAASVKFYIPFIAENTRQLINLGRGMFKLPSAEDVDAQAIEVEADAMDAAAEDGVDDGAELAGWIYAFTFPMIQKIDGPFPIKVGKTTGEVEARVASQCRQSATFELPVILGRWRARRVSPMEQAIHNVLKARGKWREEAPGTEWFDTTLAEVDAIVRFVGPL